MKEIPTKTTYLEMLAAPVSTLHVPEADVEVRRLVKPSVSEYRRLYEQVGRDYGWIDRNLMRDDDLACVVRHDLVEVYRMAVAGEEAGFSELDRRIAGQIELSYFGLFPQFIGRGLGKFFLHWTVQRAWSYEPNRVWVHTCDLDHPAALPNYLKAGFEIYDEQTIQQVVKDDS